MNRRSGLSDTANRDRSACLLLQYLDLHPRLGSDTTGLFFRAAFDVARAAFENVVQLETMLLFFADPQASRIDFTTHSSHTHGRSRDPFVPDPSMVSLVRDLGVPVVFERRSRRVSTFRFVQKENGEFALEPLVPQRDAKMSSGSKRKRRLNILAPLGTTSLVARLPAEQRTQQIRGGLLDGYLSLSLLTGAPDGEILPSEASALREFLALCWVITLAQDDLHLFASERAAREEFMSEVVHRVRRVTGPVLKFVSDLKDGGGKEERVRYLLERRLTSLEPGRIGRYLSQLEAHVGERHPEQLDLDSFVNGVVAAFNKSYEQKVPIRGLTRLTMVAFSSEIEFCVQELLLNAVKYGAPAAPIQVHLQRAPLPATNDSRWSAEPRFRLSVMSGGEIPPKLKDVIFLPRVRVDRSEGSPAQKTAPLGRGMGLFLVKRYVERHYGGQAWEDGTHGTTRFNIEVPATEA